MRSISLLLLALIFIAAIAGFFWVMSQPPEIATKEPPRPTPTPLSTVRGMGEGATLLQPTRSIKEAPSLKSVEVQASPPPKHH